jgi:hypothetical protein
MTVTMRKDGYLEEVTNLICKEEKINYVSYCSEA